MKLIKVTTIILISFSLLSSKGFCTNAEESENKQKITRKIPLFGP